MSINPLNDISKVYLEQVATQEVEIDEGMTLKDFKANRRKLKRREASADAKKRGHVGKEWYNSGRTYSPDEAKSGRAKLDDAERRTRHRSAVDPDNDNDDMYSADKTKNPKKLRKQKAMGESAVPGKPAERLGAVTAIPKSEQEAARERILAKAKAKREAMKNEALDPVGQEDADIDNDGDTDSSDKYLHKRRKAIGKAIAKKKSVKEGFSNWRQDLSEVIKDTGKEEKIAEKKVSNKININPKLNLGEAVEQLGGTLIEMVEVENLEGILDEMNDSEVFLLSDDLIEEVVQEFFEECIEEGYDTEYVENTLIESLELSSALLNEAKVTLGHDTKIESDRLEKVKSAVKKTGKAIARGAGYVAGAAVRGAKAVKREFGKGYERGRGGSSTSSSASSSSSSSSSSSDSSSGSSRPGLLGRIGSKLKSGLKKAVAKGARAVSRGARNVARKMEGGETKKVEAPKAAPKAAPKKAEKPSDPWGEPTTPPKAKAKPKAATKKAAAPKAKAPARKKKASKLDALLSDIRSESVEINEMPYQVMGSPDGGKEKKIGKPVKSKKYAAARASELADTHKATGGKYRSQYVEEIEIDEDAGIVSGLAGLALGAKGASYAAKHSKRMRDYPKNFVKGIVDPRTYVSKKKKEQKEEVQIDEKTLTKMEMKKREEIVKSMKDKASDFEKRYPGRGKEVMYATATKIAKKMAEQVMPTQTSEPAIDSKKEMMDKQKLANMKMMQQKQQMLQKQRLQMQKSGKLPLESD